MNNRLSILENNLTLLKAELIRYNEGKSCFSSREKIEELITENEKQIKQIKEGKILKFKPKKGDGTL